MNSEELHIIEPKKYHRIMNKYSVKYGGVEYPTREIEFEQYINGCGVICVADVELSNAIESKGFDKEGTQIDNGIYFYCDSGFIASDPTDAEIAYHVLCGEIGEENITDEQWYYLMRDATFEVGLRYESGEINMNCESYECGGDYSVYEYRSGEVNRKLYYGKSARMAAMVAMAVSGTINIMQRR